MASRRLTLPRALADWLKQARPLKVHEQGTKAERAAWDERERAATFVVGMTSHRALFDLANEDAALLVLRAIEHADQDERLSESGRGAIEQAAKVIRQEFAISE